MVFDLHFRANNLPLHRWEKDLARCSELLQGANHSDLATISNMEDNNIALKSKTNSTENDVWIGLNYNNTQRAWRWSDSSNASFYNWNDGQRYCVYMRRDGLWYYTGCTQQAALHLSWWVVDQSLVLFLDNVRRFLNRSCCCLLLLRCPSVKRRGV